MSAARTLALVVFVVSSTVMGGMVPTAVGAVEPDAGGTVAAAAVADDIRATAAPNSPTTPVVRYDRRVDGPRATVFFGEQNVDVTDLPGAANAGDSQTFFGVAGEARGRFPTSPDAETVDVTAANGFVEGSYNLSSTKGEPALIVAVPRVTDVTLYSGAEASGADVTNESVPTSTERVTVEARYTFDAAENVSLTVVDDDGLDVTEQLTTTPELSTSGGSVTLDVSGLDVGLYEVTVEGSDDLEQASKTVFFRVRSPEKVVSLSKTRVVRGEATIASVAGAPGDVRYLRIAADDLTADATLNTPTARAVFDATEQVQLVGADTDAGYVYAVVALDDDGLSEVRIRTARLDTGQVTVELAPELVDDSEDDVSLRVDERTVSLTEIPSTAVVGESVTVAGTAAESEYVKLYAAVGPEYVPLVSEDGDLAEADVGSDGSWEADVDTSTGVDIPGTYQVVAVAVGASRLGSSTAIDRETMHSLEPRVARSLTTVEGSLTLSASRATIADTGTDEVTVGGDAVGQGDEIRLYRIGPRGTVDLREVDVSDGTYAETFDGFDAAGTHTFVAVGHGRDGDYAHVDGSAASVGLSGEETAAAAIAKLRDGYSGAGVDDPIAQGAVLAERPRLSLTNPTTNGTLLRQETVLSGTSNREDGAPVFVEVADGDGTARLTTSTEVTNGTWTASLDVASLSTGSYTFRADDGLSRDTLEVEVVTARQTVTAASTSTTETASETATDGVSERPTATATDAREATATAVGTDGTETTVPGFGLFVTIVALVVSVVARLRVARRAND